MVDWIGSSWVVPAKVPELQRKIQLELDEKELRNKLLQRQIDLLDKAQEYRCCPDDDAKESK